MLDLYDYGFRAAMQPSCGIAEPARITAVYRNCYELVSGDGKGFGRLKAGEYYDGNGVFPTVGDFVLAERVYGGDCRIIKTLERWSCFSRSDPTSRGNTEQAVAANFDYVFIIISLNQNYNLNRLERYLTLSNQSGAQSVVILSKADLTPDNGALFAERARTVAFGAEVCAVSARTGYGLMALNRYMEKRRTVVLLGSSGVGKSSLVNALAGKAVMDVNEIRENDGKGRHTTTRRQMIMLDCGVMLIDTPGMRELGMWDVSNGLEYSFKDVERLTGGCRFNDCRHESEPGCAIKEAIANGVLAKERWNSYQKLKREAMLSKMKAERARKKSKK